MLQTSRRVRQSLRVVPSKHRGSHRIASFLCGGLRRDLPVLLVQTWPKPCLFASPLEDSQIACLYLGVGVEVDVKAVLGRPGEGDFRLSDNDSAQMGYSSSRYEEDPYIGAN